MLAQHGSAARARFALSDLLSQLFELGIEGVVDGIPEAFDRSETFPPVQLAPCCFGAFPEVLIPLLSPRCQLALRKCTTHCIA